MNSFLNAVKLSEHPKSEVKMLLECFISNTNPPKAQHKAIVHDYSDTTVFYSVPKLNIEQSISVEILLKNMTTRHLYHEIIDYDYQGAMEIKSGKITYIDSDILKPCHFSILIRMDSINRLLAGGIHEFLRHAQRGATNGRLFLMAEMRDHPFELMNLYNDLLQPNGFVEKQDFVWGYCYSDYNKPLPWCIVPWLESIAMIWNNFVRFKKD